MMGGYGYGGMGYGGLGFLWPLLQLGIVILVVFLAIQFFKKTNGDHNSSESAIEILNTRYAQGEISDEEYERRKRMLKSKK